MSEVGGSESSAMHPELTPRVSYSESLTRLQSFTNRETSEIATESQLRSSIHGIAEALVVVIADNGSLKEHKHPSGRSLNMFELDRTITEQHPQRNPGELRAYTDPKNEEYVFISKREADENGELIYEITLPINEASTDSEEFASAEWIPVDGKPGETVLEESAPVTDPMDAKLQQDYARILQLALEDILAVVKPPTVIPNEMIEQFNED